MTVVATEGPDEPPAVAPSSPRRAQEPGPVAATAAVRVLHRRAVDAVTVAAKTVIDAYDAFVASGAEERQPAGPVTPGEMIAMLSAGSGAHLRTLESAPYDPTCGDHRLDLKLNLLAAGTRIDALYADTAVDDHRLRMEIRPLRTAGARVRSLPSLPATMLIFDDVAFLVHPDDDRGDRPSRGIQALWPGPLYSAVDDLFRALWRRSVVLLDPDFHRDEPTAQTVLLLRLLAEGMPDHRVAAHLGVSPRTLHRRLQRLMVETGSTTRFQLGLQVARLGWLAAT